MTVEHWFGPIQIIGLCAAVYLAHVHGVKASCLKVFCACFVFSLLLTYFFTG